MVPLEALDALKEGVRLCLAQWTGLQLAVYHGWDTPQSAHQKVQQFQADIIAWFENCEESPYKDDLEALLDETMLLLFHAELEDDSLAEVAEELMLLHEECLQGNFERLQKLHATNASRMRSIAESQNGGSDEDDGGDLDDAASAKETGFSNVDVVSKHSTADANASARETGFSNVDVVSKHSTGASMAVDIPSNETEDGWHVVNNRRRRGRQRMG